MSGVLFVRPAWWMSGAKEGLDAEAFTEGLREGTGLGELQCMPAPLERRKIGRSKAEVPGRQAAPSMFSPDPSETDRPFQSAL